jgi:hypothetical protein
VFPTIVALGLLVGDPGFAADTAKFDAACPAAADFLVGEAPGGADRVKVMAALCPCLSAGFSGYSQADIDVLASDLAAGDIEQSKANYPGYGDLQSRAGKVLVACFDDPAVVEAMRIPDPS